MRISDWSSDVCSSDLDAAFLHARLRDDPERPERLNNLPVEKFAAAIGFDADRGNGSPTFEAAMGVDGIRQYSVHLRLLHWIEGTWRAALKRRDFKRDRQRVVSGKSVSVRVALGGGGSINKKNK